MSPYKDPKFEDPHARAANARAGLIGVKYADDPPGRATARAKAALERSLDELRELTKDIPKPADPNWLAGQGELAPSGSLAEFEDEQRGKPPALLKRGAPLQASGKRSKRTAKLEVLDATCGEEDWYRVIEAFQFSGVPATIAESTGLSTEQVEHILNQGIWRLELPPIKSYCTKLAEVNKRLSKRKLPTVAEVESKRDRDESDPDFQQAITDRISREAIVASKGLEMASLASSLVAKLVKDIVAKVESGEIFLALPPALGLEGLTSLVELVSAATRASSTAIKSSRLTAGQPTEILGSKVALLLEGRSISELEHFERTGQLPSGTRGFIEAHAETVEEVEDPVAAALALEKDKVGAATK